MYTRKNWQIQNVKKIQENAKENFDESQSVEKERQERNKKPMQKHSRGFKESPAIKKTSG